MPIAPFTTAMRNALLETCRFDWSNISPAIFGALFQSVMNPAERRAQGAHYTTEKNILKVIEPLFLDDLRAEFDRLKARKDSRRLAEIRRFQEKLGGLKFFDPACGCGNFLIIAYRELRELEMEVIRELRAAETQHDLYAADFTRVTVDQFYGIELGEFPARIAETALWMMDHIMNNRLSLEFGRTYTRIPLKTSPHVLCADALETDWAALLPPEDCSYVFGNPPFWWFCNADRGEANAGERIDEATWRVGIAAGLCRRMVSESRRVFSRESRSYRFRCNQLDHTGRTRWRNYGPPCSIATAWRSCSPTRRLPGVPMPEALRTCTS